MSTQTIKVRIATYSPADLFNDQYLSTVIEQLLAVYEKNVKLGSSNITCAVDADDDIAFYGERTETPEEERRRLDRKQKEMQEELQLLEKLQAKYKDVQHGN